MLPPTDPQWALRAPASSKASLRPGFIEPALHVAEFNQMDASLPRDSEAFESIRCGAVCYKTKWLLGADNSWGIDFSDAHTLAYNRALFIAQTQKLLSCGGMQGSRPHLQAAAQRYDINIVVWRPKRLSEPAWQVIDRIETSPSDSRTTVNLCLDMRQGDASHYRVLDDVTPEQTEPGVIVSHTGSVVETGAEHECLYLALAWSLNRAGVRSIRADYEKLVQKNQAPRSYVSYFRQHSDMLTAMHCDLSSTLDEPAFADAIDAEVQDMIIRQARKLRLL